MKRSVWLPATSVACAIVTLASSSFVAPVEAAPAASAPAPSAPASPATAPKTAAPATPAAPKTTPVAKPAPAAKATNGPAGIAATVNGANVTNSEVERALTAIRNRNQQETGVAPTAEQIAQYRSTVINVLVTNLLMAQTAAKQNIGPTKEQLDTMMTDFKQNNGLANDAELKTYLAKENKTPEDLRRLFSDQIATGKLADEWIADVTVSEADITNFYNKNPDLFKESDAVRARHILLAVAPGSTEAQRNAIKTKATQLLAKAKVKNADFAALAKANSDDPGSKAQGGEVGWFERGMMVKPFEDAAFGAPVGSIVGPVVTDFGYHILQIEEKRPAGVIPLADVKNDPRLKQIVLGQKRQTAVDAKVTALKAQATIQIYG